MYIDIPRSILADFHDKILDENGELKADTNVLDDASNVALDLEREIDSLLLQLEVIKTRNRNFQSAVDEYVRALAYIENHADESYAKDRLYEASITLRAVISDHFTTRDSFIKHE